MVSSELGRSTGARSSEQLPASANRSSCRAGSGSPPLTARIRRRHTKVALSAVQAHRGTEGSDRFPSTASRTNFQHGLESPSSPWRLSVVRSGSQFIIRPARLATGCLTGGRIASSSSPTLVVQIVRNDWFPRDGVIGGPVRELPLRTSDSGCGPILHWHGRRPGWRCRQSVP